MTGKELRSFFEEHLVPEKLYKIGGNHNNRICMEKGDSGWEVFFSEKKKKIGLMRFHDEASACRGMKEEIAKLMRAMYGVIWA